MSNLTGGTEDNYQIMSWWQAEQAGDSKSGTDQTVWYGPTVSDHHLGLTSLTFTESLRPPNTNTVIVLLAEN